jgi:tripeptide aminopeptidase
MSVATTNRTSVLERFLSYVQVDTQSAEDSETYPSTLKQLVLLDQLAAELRAMGITDATRDEHGYVFATLPANTPKANVPVIGFLAHVDTALDFSGTGVKPIVHRAWSGQDIVLPDDPTVVLRVQDLPALSRQVGNDIVTASGTTLLGADDKAGAAEIMAAMEFLLKHPEIPHGAVRIGFTPDEEVGAGTKYFDVKRFGARFAYTMDGEERGGIDVETFSADTMTIVFQGFVTHPGYAKGLLVNAIKIAARFISLLPRDRLSPETTEGREGYVHPIGMDADVDRTSVRLLIRDFTTGGLQEKEAMLERLARQTAGEWPGSSVTVRVDEAYRNFKEALDRHPEIIENAREAMRRAGVTPHDGAIRGGTDGSRLSFMGLPTPNLFTGGHNYHSRIEWASVQDMEKAVGVIVNLCRIWEETG